MNLRSIAHLPFGRRRLVSLAAARIADLPTLEKGHADKLQLRDRPTLTRTVANTKFCLLRRRSSKTDLACFARKGLEAGCIP
jgi:hypothetical protein